MENPHRIIFVKNNKKVFGPLRVLRLEWNPHEIYFSLLSDVKKQNAIEIGVQIKTKFKKLLKKLARARAL